MRPSKWSSSCWQIWAGKPVRVMVFSCQWTSLLTYCNFFISGCWSYSCQRQATFLGLVRPFKRLETGLNITMGIMPKLKIMTRFCTPIILAASPTQVSRLASKVSCKSFDRGKSSWLAGWDTCDKNIISLTIFFSNYYSSIFLSTWLYHKIFVSLSYIKAKKPSEDDFS